MAELVTDFDNQRYPTVEETVTNNASVLYKRKKFFLQDLRKLAGTLGYLLIGLVYLRDLNMTSFLARTIVQHFLSDPFPPLPHILGIDGASQEEARSYVKLVFILVSNGSAALFHLLTSTNKGSNVGDGLLYGGLSVQFIGEQPPTSVWELLILDASVFILQMLFHAITCGVDDLEVLQSVSTGVIDDESASISPEIVSNGYNGNVTLLTVDIFAHIKKVMLYRAQPMRFAMNRNSLRVMDTEPHITGLLFNRGMAERMA